MNRACALAVAVAAGLALSACGGSDSDPVGSSNGEGSSTGGAGETITVGSANFPESELLAEIYTAALEREGIMVEQRLNLGPREIYLAGLEDGAIDLIPEYTGALTLFLNPEATATAPFAVYDELRAALPEHLVVLDPSEVEDRDSLVVTSATATKYGLAAIGDLAPVAGELVLGGPRTFEDRADGVAGLRDVYGLEFSAYRPLVAGSRLMTQALVNGKIDAANIFSTDPSIMANDFVVLADPENLFVAQNLVPLVTKEANSPLVADTLNKVSASLTADDLVGMLTQTQVDGDAPAEVAQAFVDATAGD